MANNETVAKIVREMRNDAIAADAWHETYGEMASAASTLNRHADRVEAAHKRELAAKDAEIAELNDVIASNLRVHKAAEKSDSDKKMELHGEIVRRDIVIAELRECLSDAVRVVCSDCDDQDENGCSVCSRKCGVHKWRKALEGGEDGQDE